MRINYTISIAWLLAFLAMTITDTAVLFVVVPLYVGVAVNIIALGLTTTLTLRYPSRAAARL